MRTLATLLRACCLFLLLGLAGSARADGVVHYVGAHPIDPKLHKGMCFIDGPHVHAYAPHLPVLYAQVGGAWAFVGDPTEFEPTAPRYAYYGHHPLFWIEGTGDQYCFITGPHYHWQVPPPTLEFKLKGGAYWYVGKHPGWYKQHAHRHLDEHYAEIHLVHPVIAVAPPVGFVGVVIGAPGVHVDVGWPGVGVLVGPPGHYKVKHHGPPHGKAWGHHGFKGKGKGKWK